MPKPLEIVTFFLDRTVGKNIFASALRAAGVNVEVHDSHFPPNARDQEWLEVVGAKGWVVITNDRHIRYRTIELAALLNSGVRVFVFTRGNWTADEMAQVFLKALPRVLRFLKRNKGPFIATITRNANVSSILGGS